MEVRRRHGIQLFVQEAARQPTGHRPVPVHQGPEVQLKPGAEAHHLRRAPGPLEFLAPLGVRKQRRDAAAHHAEDEVWKGRHGGTVGGLDEDVPAVVDGPGGVGAQAVEEAVEDEGMLGIRVQAQGDSRLFQLPLER